MSERGSFVTQYIFCEACLEAAKSVLLERDKYLCSTLVPGWSPDRPELPIIAGKIGGLYEGEELDTFEVRLIPALEAKLCHPLRIAVLSDEGGDKIFTANPLAR